MVSQKKVGQRGGWGEIYPIFCFGFLNLFNFATALTSFMDGNLVKSPPKMDMRSDDEDSL